MFSCHGENSLRMLVFICALVVSARYVHLRNDDISVAIGHMASAASSKTLVVRLSGFIILFGSKSSRAECIYIYMHRHGSGMALPVMRLDSWQLQVHWRHLVNVYNISILSATYSDSLDHQTFEYIYIYIYTMTDRHIEYDRLSIYSIGSS